MARGKVDELLNTKMDHFKRILRFEENLKKPGGRIGCDHS